MTGEMVVIRWINIVGGALLLASALGFLIALSDQIVAYDEAPAQAWLGGFWFVVLAGLAALCFVNASYIPADIPSVWRIAVNGMTIFLLLVLLALAWEDQVGVLLLALCALGPIAALAGQWLPPRPKGR